ncbi:DUF1992 domain-containing protein [Nocardia transvalensis]|uniref:DnaJ family domain-containing protein n=1 Tax=Nocardia transvalensis TaxID=37333 RepID=UPI001892D2DF|nr:DUF1992 domain-containing protein [Nocardia transvalensis]MBF6327942.1 DUF1992 domain-containing protein [Nocardia transvalensis]
MTERKPVGMSYESWLDKQIREATERGDFDNLPGAGKPLPDAGLPYDENWWLKDYLRRENVGGEGMLPTSLLLRRDLERLPRTVARMSAEHQVREYVTKLNERITNWLRLPHGPYVQVAPVEVDEIVRQWREDRRRPAPAAATEPRTTPPRTRWWQRLTRRHEAHS